MKLYGLTGGIASGKSEAAARFVLHGIPVIDADHIGHDVIGPGGCVEQAVADAFGPDILTCGKIDREKLGKYVFGDDAARTRLNRLVHPAIFAEIGQRCEEYARQGQECVIIDAALLCEDGKKEPWLEKLVLVLAPREERLRRLITLRHMDPQDAERRINAQTPPERKCVCADWVIRNDGALDQFHAAVDEVAKVIGRADR